MTDDSLQSLILNRQAVDDYECRRDLAHDLWKSDPTVQRRVEYDVAMKKWAIMYNEYEAAIRKALGR